jgi:hypothetical protein
MIIGLTMATLYAAYATVVYLMRGGGQFAKYDTTYAATIAAYYSAGIIGGGIVGVLLPIRQNWAGALLLGLIAALVACLCIEIALSGPFWRWESSNWEEVLVLSGFFGTIAAFLFRKRR